MSSSGQWDHERAFAARSAEHAGHHSAASQNADRAVPAQLPAPTRVFVGRENEIGRLEQLRSNRLTAPLFVVITGPAGIGKTSLALRWLSGIAGEMADGQLFVDLAGVPSSAPATPSEA